MIKLAKDNELTIKIKVKMSVWDAFKLRLAGFNRRVFNEKRKKRN